jgi:small subunit ribosomal protein S2
MAKNISAILVATQPPLRQAVAKIGQEFSMPAVTQRWLGGTLTNYRVISRRVEYFKKLKSDLAANAFADYTKKEQLDLKKEADKMEEIFAGLTAMAARPDLLIVIDPILHKTAIAEARRLGIPIVAFANTDADLDEIDRPVLGNTKAVSSVLWFLEHLVKALREGRKEMEAAKTAPPVQEVSDKGAAAGQAPPAGDAQAAVKENKTEEK